MLLSFELNARLGRWAYFKSRLIRSILILSVGISYIFIWYLVVTQINSSEPPILFRDWIFEQAKTPSSTYPLGSLALFLVFVPIEIKRANDIRLKYRWLIPAFIGFFIPWYSINPLHQSSIVLAIEVLFRIYCSIIGAILLFKPGETFKDWVRTKDKSA